MIFQEFGVEIKPLQTTRNSPSLCPAIEFVCGTTLLIHLGGPQLAATDVVLM